MKIEELRVGNWVYYEGDILCEICLDTFIELYSREIELNQLTPIPLTEEILLKCGFSFPLGTDNGNYCQLGDLGFNLYNGKVLRFNYRFGNTKAEIKHLHQLQNLYFALTGTELNVDL